MGTVTKIYIVHGWTYSTERWQPLVGRLKAAGYDPTILHVPGLTTDSTEVWDLPGYVDWLATATAKETKPFILIGHSNGGRIGIAFVAQYPDRVQRLVLIDSAGIYHNEPLLRLKRTLFGGVAKIGKRLTASPKLRRVLYKVARAQDYHEAPPNMRATMINMYEADKTLPIERVTAPTTIIWGEKDRVTPLADGRTLAQRIPQSELKVVAGGRHAPVYTHPEEVGRIIVEALR